MGILANIINRMKQEWSGRVASRHVTALQIYNPFYQFYPWNSYPIYTIGSLRCIGLAVVNQQLMAGRRRRASPQRSTKQKNGLGPADTETTPPYCSFYLISEGLEFTRDLGFSGRNLGLYRQATERRWEVRENSLDFCKFRKSEITHFQNKISKIWL